MKKIKCYIILGLLACLPYSSQAQTHLVNQGHLTSGGGFVVLNNTQLANNGTINQNTGTLKMMGAATDAQSSIGGTSTSTVQNLTVSKTANNVLLHQAVTVNGTVTLEGGLVDLQNNDLTVGVITGATASRYIKTSGSGQLKQQVSNTAVTFPVGNSSYNPVDISNTGAADELGIRVEDQVLEGLTTGEAIADASINRVWHVTEATAGGSNTTITPQWNLAEELPNFDRSQAVFTSFEGGAWTAKNSGAATGSAPYQFTGTGLTTLGAFSIGNIVCETNGQAVLGIPAPTAGSDQLDICGMEVLLDAVTPSGSTGQWSITTTNGADPIFDDAMNIASSLTGVFGGMYTLRWTVSDGACANVSDEVQVSFGVDEDIPGGDGTQDCVDICLGGDDSVDSDNSGLPDDCDCSPTDASNDFVALDQTALDDLLNDIILAGIDTLLRRADLEMTSDAMIEAQGVNDYPVVLFQAASQITLSPGFHAKPGSDFTAFLEDCLPANSLLENSPTITQKQQTAFLAGPMAGQVDLQVLPNIVKQEAAVKIGLPKAQIISLQLYNQQGQLVRTLLRDIPHEKGNHYFKLDASALDGGFYVLRLQGEGVIETQKVVVAR